MSVLPVIIRELKAQARQPLTFWLRLVGGISLAGALALAFWTAGVLGTWTSRGPGFIGGGVPNPFQAFGTTLFGKLNLFIFGAIWLFVPLAAADAVSRERREGTLVLLHLTELRSLGIVVGKAFVHMLRSLSLFLTMAPWLMLPVLFGGVELRDVRMALLLDFSAVLLAMAAGLLASTIPRDWLRSVILAEIFAAVLLLLMLYSHGAVLSHAINTSMPAGVQPGTPAFWRTSQFFYFGDLLPGSGRDMGLIARTSRFIALTTNGSLREDYWGWSGSRRLNSDWQRLWAGLTPGGHAAWLRGVLGIAVGAGLVLLAAIRLAAWRVANSWQDAPEQGTVSEFRQRLFAPRFAVPFLTRKLGRALTANPIGWLQVYSPSARMVKWAWCLFIIVVEIIFSGDPDDLYGAQAGLGLLLLLGLAFSATGSFREELETGAFELLLVTPLRERQIISGRVRGLWRQFLPAILVYGAGGIYLASGWSDQERAREAWLALARIMTGFCALPLIGLYFSVMRWNFFPAWVATCLFGLLPAALVRAFGGSPISAILLQLGIGFTAVVLLERRLRHREFVQRRS